MKFKNNIRKNQKPQNQPKPFPTANGVKYKQLDVKHKQPDAKHKQPDAKHKQPDVNQFLSGKPHKNFLALLNHTQKTS